MKGRLHVVFGCGGDRDKGKRPEMGWAATSHADAVYITDDNPRSEDPAVIRREILAGAPGAIEIAKPRGGDCRRRGRIKTRGCLARGWKRP